MTNNRQRQQLNYASEYEVVSVVALGDETRRIYRKKVVNGRWRNSYTERVEMLKVAWRPTWYEVSLLDKKQKAMIKEANVEVLGPVEESTDLFAEDSMWLIRKCDNRLWQVNYGHLKRHFEHELLDYFAKQVTFEVDDVPQVELAEEAAGENQELNPPILSPSITPPQEKSTTQDELSPSKEFNSPTLSTSSENDENHPLDAAMEIDIKELSNSTTPCPSPIDRPRRSIQTPIRFLDN
ncbi:unnamed protein product, partial [Mesorhabditis belari]|uniref:Uncharacterized protein n=1 Tax=Mesorhabditis belari TaxID=2138241 RepID=A0AAF3FNB1_9BILA